MTDRVTEIPTRNVVITVVLDELMDHHTIDAYKVIIGMMRGVVAVGETSMTAEQKRMVMAERRQLWRMISDAFAKARWYPDDRARMVCEQCLLEARNQPYGLIVLKHPERCTWHPHAKLVVPELPKGP